MEKINMNKEDDAKKPKEAIEIPKEFPNKVEQIKILEEKISELEKILEKYNLPEIYPGGRKHIPDYLRPQEKEEIIRIEGELEDAKIRKRYLENN